MGAKLQEAFPNAVGGQRPDFPRLVQKFHSFWSSESVTYSAIIFWIFFLGRHLWIKISKLPIWFYLKLGNAKYASKHFATKVTFKNTSKVRMIRCKKLHCWRIANVKGNVHIVLREWLFKIFLQEIQSKKFFGSILFSANVTSWTSVNQ